MYFEIDNTPEHLRKLRRTEQAQKGENAKEECPRLILAPFSKPPQVLFDNVIIGTCCERNLEVFNPTKCTQQVMLAQSLPHGLDIDLPDNNLVLEPETCYCLTISWTPVQPVALRETIRFTNERRGRYDVIVVLKSAVDIKGTKNSKTTAKTKKKPLKKSPVAIAKKKIQVNYNNTTVKRAAQIISPGQFKKAKSSNKENMSGVHEYSMDSQLTKCPFDSPNSTDILFDTSEIFSNMKRPHEVMTNQTYDKSPHMNYINDLPMPRNILKPSNIQSPGSTDIFDSITFTPLKSVPQKNDKLEHGPKIILSVNSDCEDDSLENKENDEKGPQSIIYVTSSQAPNKWTSSDPVVYSRNRYLEPEKKIPNTSSPKELHSPNFSINTDFSRISDLTFCPPRFSTERKLIPKVNNETHDLIDDIDMKLNSETFTKEFPNTALECPIYFIKDQNPSKCRQSLFRENNFQREFDRNKLYSQRYETNVWKNEARTVVTAQSPPRSLTPPLQSIPEESNQNSDTHIIDKTDIKMSTFTLDRTFNTTRDKHSISSNRLTWSKKDVRADPTLWKVPVLQPEKSSRPKASGRKSNVTGLNQSSNATFECKKSNNQNILLNLVDNVYSQSLTVDPFLSSTYFYDEEAVARFEKEFKHWLNYILTPPADLDCNVEEKIDVGKAWIENRNKEVPLAPTKEQVSSAYHNSHRLESLRRSAKTLLLSPEICLVFQKLNAQIEKKLIVIRTDRNLHLDVGLQKAIMELLLCYNPLWLRIGLEALYCIVLPLKSNSDIFGITTFIIQRMFKNPFLKNKHSKSSAPNMLLPAYMEAIKKFTLKKFFMLVYFLDQAKQRKLISHDPCLFRRNAICKESREIIIRFTRELIAGIGDITKHLRPLGYVVSHKQTYLDEYMYAVHNVAVDIRDGVRLTKVMEIILMKNGLVNQLRTPAISRLQKIHNVQVALNALKEAKFVIVGDISATDIADGHREKTMSLLWQLIHVFRAPLFETAANKIQIWWKKKYTVIVEKRKEDERLRLKLDNAARTIQCWWRKVQYNRLVEKQMQMYLHATIIIQKHCRRWLCRTRMLQMKSSVLKIEKWYGDMKKIRKAKEILERLKLEREQLRHKAAIEIQRNFRRWVCVTRYQKKRKSIVLIQSKVRAFLARKRYLQIRKFAVIIQQRYRGKLLMKEEMKRLAIQRRNAITIQKQYRMLKQFRNYQKLKSVVKVIESHYEALIKMRRERSEYLRLKKAAIILQSLYRGRQVRKDYTKQKYLIIKLQNKIRAHQMMVRERSNFTIIKNAACVLQNHFRRYLIMKKTKQLYVTQRKSAIVIQRRFRAYLLGKSQRSGYIQMRDAAIRIQRRYRSLIVMRREKSAFIKLKTSSIRIQRNYRAMLSMRICKNNYENLRAAIVLMQRKYRARLEMKLQRSKYLQLKKSCIRIQTFYRAVITGRRQRNLYEKQKLAAIKIQHWFRNCKKSKEVQQQYQQTRQACVTIQRIYRNYVISKKQRMQYLRIKTSTMCIQRYYRSYIEMKTVKEHFIQLKTSTVTIQRFYRSYLLTKKQREEYLRIRSAVVLIQNFYRRYKETTRIRQEFCHLKQSTIFLQRQYRSILAMRKARADYEKLQKSALTIQRQYRALLEMRAEHASYLKLKSATLVMQKQYRAKLAMKCEQRKYNRVKKACVCIQRFLRAHLEGKKQRDQYLKIKKSAISLQRRYRAILSMRRCKNAYLLKKTAIICIQRRFRAHSLMLQERTKFLKIVKACSTIQRYYRAYVAGSQQRKAYLTLKSATVVVQRHYRNITETRKVRKQYLLLKQSVLIIQRTFRAIKEAREIQRQLAATKIQIWYKSLRSRNICRTNFLKIKHSVILIQSQFRMYTTCKKWRALKNAAIAIQKFYRSYRTARNIREEYVQMRKSVIKLQSHVRGVIIRKRYLLYLKEVQDRRREAAAVCIQKNIRQYLARSLYLNYRNRVVFVQRLWRGKLLTRILRHEFLQKKEIIIKLQAIIRGYLARQRLESKRKNLIKAREEQRRHWAASKIQALARGAAVRALACERAASLRRRWRLGALLSAQDTLSERYEEAMEVLTNFSDMESIIKAFKSLGLLTEVYPMMYDSTAPKVVDRVFKYMSVMNRSISSVEVLKLAAGVLANLARYRITGPNIYAREHISEALTYMWRFSTNETQLFLILCTYLWLFAKYDAVREDLTEYLNVPKNRKMMVSIKEKVDRMRRMEQNVIKHKPTPMSKPNHNSSVSCCAPKHILLPALEPDYGIRRVNQRRYFEDTQQAIHCLFRTYNL